MITLKVTRGFFEQMTKLINEQVKYITEPEMTGVTDEFQAAIHAYIVNKALLGLRASLETIMAKHPAGSVEIASDDASMLSQIHKFAEAYDECEKLVVEFLEAETAASH